jgi:hypothetical protein
MSRAELNALERDVEQARARFADDLARLRSPTLKDDLWAEARETKDEMIEKTKEAARDGVQRIVADLKERAAANPVAVLAVGAGLAWRLYRHPPIASLLVGYGLVSLLRTLPSARAAQTYMGLQDEDPQVRRYGRENIAARTSELAASARDRVQEWGERAGTTARETTTQIGDKAATVADRATEATRATVMQLKEKATSAADRTREAAGETVSQIKEKASSVADRTREAAGETVSQIKEKAASVADRASGALHDTFADPEIRDRMLLGAAALAVAAAVGIAYQRSQEDA